MNALALTFRTLWIVFILLIVVRKAWPGDVLGTPLAQLTLGQLLFGVFQAAIGMMFGAWLIFSLLNFPAKDKRTSGWREWWIGLTLTLASIVGFALLYEPGSKNALIDSISGFVLSVIGWAIF